MLAWLHLAERRSPGWAVALGAAVGRRAAGEVRDDLLPALRRCWPRCSLPAPRIGWRDAAVAAAVALAASSRRTWSGTRPTTSRRCSTPPTTPTGRASASTSPASPSLSAASSRVAGPVFFAAYLVGLARSGAEPRRRFLALMSLPISRHRLGAGAGLGRQRQLGGDRAYRARCVLAAALLARPPALAGGGPRDQPRDHRGAAGRRGLRRPLARRPATWCSPATSARRDAQPSGPPTVAREARARHAGQRQPGDARRLLLHAARRRARDLRRAGRGLPAAPLRAEAPAAAGSGRGALRHDDAPACRDPGVVPELVAAWTPEDGYRRKEVQAWRVSATLLVPRSDGSARTPAARPRSRRCSDRAGASPWPPTSGIRS